MMTANEPPAVITSIENQPYWRGIPVIPRADAPQHLEDFANHFAPRCSDVWICGYPRTGCHWNHEVIYRLLMNDAGFKAPGKAECFVDMAGSQLTGECTSAVPPRVLNTHVPPSHYTQLVPSGSRNKIVLTVRDPKDVAISYFHMLRHIPSFTAKQWNDFQAIFLHGEVYSMNYADYMTAWNDFMADPEIRQRIRVVYYEDMASDTLTEVKRMAEFLELATTTETIREIVEATDFGKMKAIQDSRPTGHVTTLRKGVVGDWKNDFTAQQAQQFDARFKESWKTCRNIDLWKHYYATM